MTNNYKLELTENQMNMILSALADYQDYIDPDDIDSPVNENEYNELVDYLNAV